MKKKVRLIGGRLDGSSASVEEDRDTVTVHETDVSSNLRTGLHIVYRRMDDERFIFDSVYVDGVIIEFNDGPLKGSKTQVPCEDGFLLMRCQDGTIAAYLKKGKDVSFAKSFPRDHEAEAEAFAKENIKE